MKFLIMEFYLSLLLCLSGPNTFLKTLFQDSLCSPLKVKEVSLSHTHTIQELKGVLQFEAEVNVKVEVRLSLCLIKRNTVIPYGSAEEWLRAFLTSSLDGGQWSASRLIRFTSGGKTWCLLDKR